MNTYDTVGAHMKPGLYYYEPKDMLYEYRYYNVELKFSEIYYYDFMLGDNITFMDPELSQEFIKNSIYIGEV